MSSFNKNYRKAIKGEVSCAECEHRAKPDPFHPKIDRELIKLAKKIMTSKKLQQVIGVIGGTLKNLLRNEMKLLVLLPS